ncbi:MAG: ABC transporter substrate-binding protein, partial [Caldilineae bacterium]
MLAELVASGDLPPVDERLPVNPMVMPVAEMVGNYGGGFRRGFKGVSDRWGPTKCQDRGLAWYDQNLNMQPRMAESWEINDDASEWTFNLRQGMKWSDGHPLTTADVEWWWNHEILNTEITPSVPSNWRNSDGTPAEIEVIDDHTFKVKFNEPNPLFIFRVGRITNAVFAPGHYMAQFHIELTDDPDKLQADAEAAGFNSWSEYYIDRRWWYLNPEKPSFGPWVAKNELSNELFIMERNPYFFAVDADGKQLPYVDAIHHRLFESNEVFNLRIINGEIDFQARHVQLDNFTLYKENEDKGDYKVFIGTSAGHVAIQLNLTTKNERLREFFNKRNVRIALSLAVDRNALNELVYDGLLTPRQYSPLSKSPQAYPKQANAYIEYDPDEANRLLDEAGYSEKNADGFRVWPGTDEPISFVIEGTAPPGSQGEDAVQQVIKYYEAVGIKASYKSFERSLYEEHWGANEIEAAWWGGDRTVLPIVAPWIFTGTMVDRPWAAAWGLWYNSNGTDPNGEEPPADHWIWKIWDLWEKMNVEPDPEKRNELFRGILDIWAEELPMIGYLGESPALIIVKNGVRNYLPGFPIDDTTGDEHLLNTETYFWEDPSKSAIQV